MKKLNEDARQDYYEQDRRKRLFRDRYKKVWRSVDGKWKEVPAGPIPTDDEVESAAKSRRFFGKNSPRPEPDERNRTEKRRTENEYNRVPWSFNDMDREDDIEYRTDTAGLENLSHRYTRSDGTKEDSDTTKIKHYADGLIGAVLKLCPSIHIDYNKAKSEATKTLISVSPEDALAMTDEIETYLHELTDVLGELDRSGIGTHFEIKSDFNKATAKRKLPESVESPFNGMSVSQMRFLNEGMMDDSRYSVSFRGGALDPHPISIEVDADCEQTALEMAVAKLEKEYEGRCLIDPQEVENGGDDYNEDNALYIDATMEGASQPWYVDPQMVHIEELPPRGYDSDGYDSMDDNALPEDF